jgi:hypothetical protein
MNNFKNGYYSASKLEKILYFLACENYMID